MNWKLDFFSYVLGGFTMMLIVALVQLIQEKIGEYEEIKRDIRDYRDIYCKQRIEIMELKTEILRLNKKNENH